MGGKENLSAKAKTIFFVFSSTDIHARRNVHSIEKNLYFVLSTYTELTYIRDY